MCAGSVQNPHVLRVEPAPSRGTLVHSAAIVASLGDGVMASFGYPRGRENDAEQAVMAGFALLCKSPRLETEVGSELVARGPDRRCSVA